MILLEEDTLLKDILKNEKKVILDFYTDTCIPCKNLEVILKEIEKEFPDIEVIKINAIQSFLPAEYNIKGVPTLVFIQDGEVKYQFTGVINKQKILEMIYYSFGG